MNILAHEKREMPLEDRTFYIEMAAAAVAAAVLALAV